MVESGKGGVGSSNSEELLVGDDDGERLVASVEDQLRKEMTVYEVCVLEYIISSIIMQIFGDYTSFCFFLISTILSFMFQK